jgi:hypothetical protein
VASAALCLLAASARPSLAQDPTTTTATTTGSTPPALHGLSTAKATALTLRVAPTVGALALAVQSGVSVSEVRNNLAQAESKSVDLGILGSSLTGEPCSGGDPPFREDQLPHGIRTDNREGDSTVEDAGIPLAGSTLSGSYQVVRATGQPLSEAQTTTGQANLGGLLVLREGQATATTDLVDGGAGRESHAVVTFDLEIPGVLVLSDMRWEAYHKTESGQETDAHASFTIGGVSLLGQAIPVEDLPTADVLDQLNPVLQGLGITLHVPREERFTDPADLIRITPLRITFADNPVGRLVLGPVLDASRELRDNIAQTLIAARCDTASAFLVSEILIGQLTGTGSMNVDVGGVEALTGFEEGQGLPTDPTFTPGPLEAAELPVTAPPAAPAAVVPSGGVSVPPAAPPAARTPAISTQPIGSFERLCESVHPFRWPSCSAGAGPFVGLGGILAVAALGLADWQHQRRRARRAEGTT